MNMTKSLVTDETIAPPFTAAAPTERIDRVAEALLRHNIEAVVVGTSAEAREWVLGMLPEGAEVHWGTSLTLEEIGLTPELLAEGRYDAVRPRYLQMDRATQTREIGKLSAAPDFMLGSVHAITDDGALVVVSYSGSQIGPYASGAGRVILVVGSQKIVADLDEGMRRARDHVKPYEDASLMKRIGVPSKLAKLLVIFEDASPGRVTVVLVREPVGV
jgi:L-lactate utilization protein LutC